MAGLDIPFSPVSSRIYGHQAFELGMMDVFQSWNNDYSEERLTSVYKVCEAAAGLVMEQLELHPLSVSPGENFRVSDEDLAGMFLAKAKRAQELGLPSDPESFLELLALNSFLGTLPFSEDKFAAALPVYGE